MRTLLTMMTAALLIVAIGCAPEAETAKKPESSNPAPATTESKTETEAAPAGEFSPVSLKVPGMT